MQFDVTYLLIYWAYWVAAVASGNTRMAAAVNIFAHPGQKFITRLHMRVNRTATCWLIRRFVNPEAEILFVPADNVSLEQNHLGAIGFDAPGATYPHADSEGRCSFKAIVHTHPLLAADPVLIEMGEIVQAADMSGQVNNHPAAFGLQLISKGFPETSCMNDDVTIEKSKYLYDSLYNSIKEAMATASSKTNKL